MAGKTRDVKCPNCGNIQTTRARYGWRCKNCDQRNPIVNTVLKPRLEDKEEKKEQVAPAASSDSPKASEDGEKAEELQKAVQATKKQLGLPDSKEDMKELNEFMEKVQALKAQEAAEKVVENTAPDSSESKPKELNQVNETTPNKWDCGECGAKEVLPFGEDCYCPQCGTHYTKGDWKSAES